ncbi:MAG: glycosyltransferase family 2 protein [Verrucomicrobia bacterium]|nr:glycosyltransferase family 2 protein [Verrucomicrobiota bacterium]
MKVSIIIPMYNEQENVAPLSEELDRLRSSLDDVEALLIDDGSRDGTWAAIEDAAARYPVIRGIRSVRNRGQSAAMLLGFAQAAGDIIVTMDGDLQNNPADIPRLVMELDRADVACGYRAKRRDSWSRRMASRIGNGIRNRVTRDGLRDTGCSLKAFRAECAADIPPFNGCHRFMGAYFKLHGRTMVQLPVDHRARQFGSSKYTNLKRLPKTTFDLIGFLWYRSRYLSPTTAIETT